MSKNPNSERGVVHILSLLLLVVGIGFGIYLIGQRTNWLPKAAISSPVVSGPIASINPSATPAPVCQNTATNFIAVLSCGTDSNRLAVYQCSNGSTGLLGGFTSCATDISLRQQANAECAKQIVCQSPAPSVAPSIAPSVAPSPIPLPSIAPSPTPTPAPPVTPGTITDNFTRANNTTTLGTTQTGQVWQYTKGTFGIIGNNAYVVSGCPAPGYALVDAGAGYTNGTLQVVVSQNAQDLRIPYRYVDENNYYWFETKGDGYGLYQKNAGRDSQLAFSANRNLTGPVTVTINLSANVTYVYINGSFAMFHTHPAIFRRTNVSSFGTKYGIGTWCGTGMRFQNFSFTGQK